MKNNIITENGQTRCTKFKSCGGCSYDMSYEQQTERKQQAIKHKLARFGRVSPVLTMEYPYRARCKVTRVYKRAANGHLIAGIFKSKSLGCVPVYDCMLEDKRLCRIACELAAVFESFKIQPFDFKTGKGALKHIMLRKGLKTGEILLCIVTAPHTLKSPRALAAAIEKRFPDITTIVHNECSNSMPMTLGEKEHILKGSGYIEDKLLGFRFRISAGSFMQVNPLQTEKLYSLARDMLGDDTDTLLDAYCGTGTIGLICSGMVKRLIGVEQTPSAIKDAEHNAAANGIHNADFVCADAGQFMRSLAKDGAKVDAVIMDPPRAGADRRFLESLGELAPERVIYISCSPETLARDLYRLRQLGYKAEKIQPVDMFPHTRHIECAVGLIRAGSGR